MANQLLGLGLLCLVVLGAHFGTAERQETKLDREGAYILGWEADANSDQITFDVLVRTTGFVGFGFAPKANMDDADILIGGIKDDEVYFSDRYSIGKMVPMVDDQQDWTIKSGWENGTHTFLQFSRALDTCDSQDIKISADTLNIIWSYGETDEIGYHGTHRGGRQFNLFDPPEPYFDTSELEKWEVRVNDTVPAQQTSYLCTIHKLRKFETKKHMIALEAYLGDDLAVTHTHHFTATGCDLKDPAVLAKVKELEGKPGQECYVEVYRDLKRKCNQILFGWAVGGKRIVLPDHLGVPVGDPNVQEEQYIMFEVHYDNPYAKPNMTFTSGFNVYFTDKLRKVEGSVIMIGVDILPALFVPPHTTEFTLAGHCSSQYTQQFLPPEGIQIVSVNMHSHLAGRRLKVRHFRGDQELPWLLSDDHYDFDYQQTRQLPNEVTLMPGDHVTMECVMSTTNKSTITLGGESTHDEMCHVFLFYYPKIDLVACRSFYPLNQLFHKFGILGYDDNVNEILNPNITSPKGLVGKRFADVANLHKYTPKFVQELQEDLRNGEHIASYIVPAGADKSFSTNSERKVNKTSYPHVSNVYAPADGRCSQIQGRDNGAHSVLSSVSSVLAVIMTLIVFNLF